jgi:hypothetical protein
MNRYEDGEDLTTTRQPSNPARDPLAAEAAAAEGEPAAPPVDRVDPDAPAPMAGMASGSALLGMSGGGLGAVAGGVVGEAAETLPEAQAGVVPTTRTDAVDEGVPPAKR